MSCNIVKTAKLTVHM